MGEEVDASRMSMTGEEGVVISDVSSISLGEDDVITGVSCISIVVEDMVGPQVKEDREPVRRTRQQPELSGFLVDLSEMNIASGSNPMSTLVNRSSLKTLTKILQKFNLTHRSTGCLLWRSPILHKYVVSQVLLGRKLDKGSFERPTNTCLLHHLMLRT
jgi:hypothetical protein